MKRFDDWPDRLAEFMKREQNRPFAWGESDCALFVCDCILALTGEDLAKDFRGRYTTQRGAYRVLKRIGKVSSLEELATKNLGPPIQVSYAQRGDVVSIPTSLGTALGIIVGIGAMFKSPSGLVMSDRNNCLQAWRV